MARSDHEVGSFFFMATGWVEGSLILDQSRSCPPVRRSNGFGETKRLVLVAFFTITENKKMHGDLVS